MLLKPLKRVPLPGSTTAELVELSAGSAVAFMDKLNEFPKEPSNNPEVPDSVKGAYFAGLRALVHMCDNGKPFLPQLINHLHEQNPDQWGVKVLEDESVSSTLDAVDQPYLARVIDYFMDNVASTQLEEINEIIRTEVWPDRNKGKND